MVVVDCLFVLLLLLLLLLLFVVFFVLPFLQNGSLLQNGLKRTISRILAIS